MIVTVLLALATFQAGAPAPKAPAAGLRLEAGAGFQPALIEAWTDGFMATGLRQAQVAGAVVVVVQGDRIVLAKGYGYADVARKIPVDPERTGFRPGSVSKLMTATAVLQLVEQGKLDLDRDVNEYLDFPIRSVDGSPITTRHLLTHSAGFTQLLKALGYVDPKLVVPLAEYVRRYVPPSVYRPGSTSAYSNYSIVLAGYLVQRISGEPFEEYVENHIFRPLGMNRSTFRQPLPDPLAADLSMGYLTANGPTQPFEILGTMPAGGATSTGTDMARFMIAHLQQGRSGDSAILRPETFQLMHTPANSPSVPPGFSSLGLGFRTGTEHGQRTVGHGGDTIAFHAALLLWLDAGVGVYVAVNSLGSGFLDGNGVVAAYLDRFGERFLPGPSEPTPPAVATAAEHAALAAGRYLSSRRFERSFLSLLNLQQVAVHAKPDGTISIPSVVDRLGTPKVWREVDPWIWQEVDGTERLAMTVEGGRVREIRQSTDAATVLQRADGLRKASWNVPLLLGTVVVLLAEALRQLLTGLLGRFRRNREPSIPRTKLERVGQLGLVAAAMTLVGWMGVIYLLFSGDYGLIGGTRDVMLRTLQVIGAIAVLLSPAAMAATVSTIRQRKGVLSKAWCALLLFAFPSLVWFAFAFHLLGPSLMY